MRQVIDVTQEDIDNANSNRAKIGGIATNGCPIAFALWRMFPDGMEVYAHPDFCRIYLQGYQWGPKRTFETTKTMRTFMRRWDRTSQAKPTRFFTTERR